MVSVGPAGLFSIDEKSGKVALTSSLDYESLPALKQHQITIRATDGGGLQVSDLLRGYTSRLVMEGQ